LLFPSLQNKILKKTTVLLVAYSTLLLLLLFSHLRKISFIICDDAYISFRYARNLATKGQLVFNLNQYIEGISNFFWTILLGFLHFLSVPLSLAAHGLNLLSALGVLVLVGLITKNLQLKSSSVTRIDFAFMPPLLLVVWTPFVAWISGGLETIFFTFFFCASPLATLNNFQKKGKFLSFSLLWLITSFTRNEGFALFAIATGWIFIVNLFNLSSRPRKFRRILGRLLLNIAVFAIASAFYFGFKYWYYGNFLPNTWYAKIYGIPPDFLWKKGILYLKHFFQTWNISYWLWFSPLLLPSLIKKTSSVILILLFTTFWLLWTAKAGGDFMAAHRFLVPSLPFLAILAGLALDNLHHLAISINLTTKGISKLQNHSLLSSSSNKPQKHLKKSHKNLLNLTGTVAAALLAGYITFNLHYASRNFEKVSLASERHHWGMESLRGAINYVEDRVKVGKALRKAVGETLISNISLAVGGAGAISFMSKAGKIIDSFGLNDKVIARKKIKAGRFYKAGHLKQASWKYLKSKAPDIVCTPGIATIGTRPPTQKHRQRVLAYWKNYSYFCLILPLSKNDHNIPRTNYCCIKRKNRFPRLTLETTIK
jgi:arabinofuranosyltransferase